MEPTSLILVAIVFIILLILLTVLFALIYSGLLHDIIVKVGSPPLEEFTGFYKMYTGPYKEVCSIFTEATNLAPTLDTFGIYYDDPNSVESEDLRSLAGSVLLKGQFSEEEAKKFEDLFEKHGFKRFTFKRAETVVKADFPHVSFISMILAIYRVYPQLSHFIKVRKLTAHPFIEYYSANNIHFFAPLNNHGDFYPPQISKQTDQPQQ